MIRTWEDVHAGWDVARLAMEATSSVGDRSLPGPLDETAKPAVAVVSASRWVARCPAEGCDGAEYVSFDDPVFFCCECRNAEVGHALRPVELPDTRTREQVETYLCARPVEQTRNWQPGETVKDLRAENRAHGIRLDRA